MWYERTLSKFTRDETKAGAIERLFISDGRVTKFELIKKDGTIEREPMDKKWPFGDPTTLENPFKISENQSETAQ